MLDHRAIKDLRVIQNRSLESLLIIDNCVASFGSQVANGIPILPYKGGDNDKELLLLRDYLLRLLASDQNMVDLNSQFFGIELNKNCKESSQYLEFLKATEASRSLLMTEDQSRPTQDQPPSDSESC